MKQYHIEYNQLENGAIRLTQGAYGSDGIVDLHPMQLRAIAEYFDLVEPLPPADELTIRLAEQLCEAYLALTAQQRYWSPALGLLWERLDVQVACLPSEIFPHHLWEQREEVDNKQVEKMEASAAVRQQSQSR